jgi:hypothetical protein
MTGVLNLIQDLEYKFKYMVTAILPCYNSASTTGTMFRGKSLSQMFSLIYKHSTIIRSCMYLLVSSFETSVAQKKDWCLTHTVELFPASHSEDNIFLNACLR